MCKEVRHLEQKERALVFSKKEITWYPDKTEIGNWGREQVTTPEQLPSASNVGTE